MCFKWVFKDLKISKNYVTRDLIRNKLTEKSFLPRKFHSIELRLYKNFHVRTISSTRLRLLRINLTSSFEGEYESTGHTLVPIYFRNNEKQLPKKFRVRTPRFSRKRRAKPTPIFSSFWPDLCPSRNTS